MSPSVDGNGVTPAAGEITRPFDSRDDARRGAIALQLPEAPGERLWIPIASASRQNLVRAIFEASDGSVWVGTTRSLLHFDIRERAAAMRAYTTEHGLVSTDIHDLGEDHDGNLWIASSGAMKLTRRGFVTYTTADGLGDAAVHGIFETRAGVLSVASGDWVVNTLDGDRFRSLTLRTPADAVRTWGSQTAVLDRADRWWLLAMPELWRLPPFTTLDALDRPLPSPVRPDELSPGVTEPVSRLFQSRTGDLWFGLSAYGRVVRWEQANGRKRAVYRSGWTAGRSGDRVWRRCARRALGRLPHGPRRAAAERTVHGLRGGASGPLWRDHRDPRGRGRTVVDRQHARRTRTRRRSIGGHAGLSSLHDRRWPGQQQHPVPDQRSRRLRSTRARRAASIASIRRRATCVTTPPSTGSRPGLTTSAYRDARGRLWFGTTHGLSRLDPSAPPARVAPPVWIGALRIAGSPRHTAHLGERTIAPLTLEPNENQVDVEFFGLSFAMGESLRYQYMLEGADTDWTGPTPETTVHYSALAPGDYRFVVRAMSADGTVSTHPATIPFTVRPPLWQRAWFRLLVVHRHRPCRDARLSPARGAAPRARTRAHAHRQRSARRHRLEPVADGDPERSREAADRRQRTGTGASSRGDCRERPHPHRFDERHRLVDRSAS